MVLQSQSQVVRLDEGRWKLSEETRQQHLASVRDASDLLQQVKITFSKTFDVLPEGTQVRWADFKERFLVPLVYELGARTYHIVTGMQGTTFGETSSYLQFVSRFDVTSRPVIRNCISAFIDPQSEPIRQYMLRLLNTAFLAQALMLPGSSVSALLMRTEQPLRFIIFVDTNYLFSLMGLHEHPADEVVRALRDIVTQASGRVDIKFYVLPSTVQEAQQTIAIYYEQLAAIQLTRPLARAIRDGRSGLSGIPLMYVKNAYKDGDLVSAKDYLAPYMNNFVEIARSKGVELYNAPVDSLSADQAVIDDLTAQLEYEKRKSERTSDRYRRKPYEAVRHDMILWHFAKGKRPSGIASPLDAVAWVVTLDNRLIRFDEFKKAVPPVCIHPTVLLQVLQLWVPGSDALNAALMDSLRAMLPSNFDHATEKTTIRIARVLSRYELGDLDHDTIARILLNDAVRSRIEEVKSEEEERSVIESELVGVNRELRVQLDRYKREYEKHNRQLVGENRRYREETRQLHDDIDGLKGRLGHQMAEKQDEVAKRRVLERRVATFQTVGLGLIGTLATWGVCGYIAFLTPLFPWDQNLIAKITLAFIVLAIGVGTGTSIAGLLGRKSEVIQNDRWVGRLAKFARWCWGVVGSLVLVLLSFLLSISR